MLSLYDTLRVHIARHLCLVVQPGDSGFAFSLLGLCREYAQ